MAVGEYPLEGLTVTTIPSSTYATVLMRIVADYTEPPGNYGQPIGSRVTTQTATARFVEGWDCWVAAGTLANQQAAALAQFGDATKDMRAQGQTFTIISNTQIATRPNSPPRP